MELSQAVNEEPSHRNTLRIYVLRGLRAFSFGYLNVVLGLYLAALGFGAGPIGLFITAATVGSMLNTVVVSGLARRAGRRTLLAAGGGLIGLTGLLLLGARGWSLYAGALLGVLPPSGNGLFTALEQALLADNPRHQRTAIFAHYNLVGSVCTATGALLAGVPELVGHAGYPVLLGYRLLLGAYVLVGIVTVVLALKLDGEPEYHGQDEGRTGGLQGATLSSWVGLHEARTRVLKLAGLFSIDAFGGGFIPTTLIAYWLSTRFGMSTGALGALFFGTDALAAVSFVAAVPIAKRIGLVNTMVFSHIPANLLLVGLPFVGTAPVAAVLLLARGLLSQMDVPTRQAYIASVVSPSERTAAAGITTVGRQIGASASPGLAGYALQAWGATFPFIVGAAIKIGYDVVLWRSFHDVKPAT